MSAPANYDLNEIFEALADTFNGLDIGEDMSTVATTITAKPRIGGQLQVPAVVFELDGLEWDLNMGDGADGITIIATVLVQFVSEDDAQRQLLAFLSRKDTAGVARMKKALEDNETLAGTVSYAHMGGLRRVGVIEYEDTPYLGAEIVIGVVS